MQKDSRLCDLGLLEIFGSPVEHDICYSEAEDFIRSLEHIMCYRVGVIEFFRHSRKLRSLAGENISFLHFYILFKDYLSEFSDIRSGLYLLNSCKITKFRQRGVHDFATCGNTGLFCGEILIFDYICKRIAM